MTKPTYTYQIELWNGDACTDAWYLVEKHEGITDAINRYGELVSDNPSDHYRLIQVFEED